MDAYAEMAAEMDTAAADAAAIIEAARRDDYEGVWALVGAWERNGGPLVFAFAGLLSAALANAGVDVTEWAGEIRRRHQSRCS